MILINTSIWIDHLRAGLPRLEALLHDARVLCHPYIIGELACGNLGNRGEILALVQALPTTPVLAMEEFCPFVERNRLDAFGIGFVEVHLLASARLAGVVLWTKDRRLGAAAEKLGLTPPA